MTNFVNQSMVVNMKSATTTKGTQMTAIPTNEFDATTEAVFSVFAPHFRQSNLIARNVSYARARQIAEVHGALVFLTADIA